MSTGSNIFLHFKSRSGQSLDRCSYPNISDIVQQVRKRNCWTTNDVDHLETFAFFRTKKIEFLSFQKNAFKHMSRVSELDLNDNKLTSRVDDVRNASCFPREVICDLKNLIVLRISSNHLSEIFESKFRFAFSLIEMMLRTAWGNLEIKRLVLLTSFFSPSLLSFN